MDDKAKGTETIELEEAHILEDDQRIGTCPRCAGTVDLIHPVSRRPARLPDISRTHRTAKFTKFKMFKITFLHINHLHVSVALAVLQESVYKASEEA